MSLNSAYAGSRARRKNGGQSLVVCEKPTHALFRDLTGQSFGRLHVESYAGRISGQNAFWCRCECGGRIAVRGACLTGEITRSCGCLIDERGREMKMTHGLTGSPEYEIYRGMRMRCLNPNVKSYPRYGGRGITICERWLHGEGGLSGAECFVADMGSRPSPDHSIERRNVNGPYSPDNCLWADRSTQAKNTSVTPHVTYNGRTASVHEWEVITGIPATQIAKRLGRGWSPERALTQPMRVRS
jgi:hypothetical protein